MLDTLTDRITALNSDKLPQILAMSIAAVILVLLGEQSISIFQTATYAPTIQTVNAVTTSTHSQQYNAAIITDRNLFGNAQLNPEQLQQTNLPTTTLQVALRGVFTSSTPSRASAIIERPDGLTRSYKVGVVVFGKTRLHAVFNDRIVLSTQGQLETLYFPDPSDEYAEEGTKPIAMDHLPSGVEQLVQSNMTAEEIQQASQQLKTSAMTPEQRKALIRQRLLDLRSRARENNQ